MVDVLDSCSSGGKVTAHHERDADKAHQAAQARKLQQAALFRHDIFNLIALAIVNSLNCWYLLYGRGAHPLSQDTG
jgi:hypothetical protein